MKCPKCGMGRSLDDRLCRRCKYVFDEDRFVGLTPPRASERTLLERLPGLDAGRAARCFEALRSRPWVPIAASVFPGLGHLLLGRRGTGLLYLFLVGVSLACSLLLFSGAAGQMLFGLAVATHATSILALTSWGRSSDLKRRMGGMAAVLTALMALYWPLLDWLSRTFVAPVRVEGRGRSAWDLFSPQQVVTLLVLFAVTAWVSSRMSSRES